MGDFRLVPSVCDVVNPTIRSKRFICAPGAITATGETDFVETYDPSMEKVYRTFFGPFVPHSGLIYADCDNNFNKAATRLFSITAPDCAAEQRLIDSQRRHFHRHHTMRRIIRIIRRRFSVSTCDLSAWDEFHDYVHSPHPKRKLRVAAFNRLCEEGRLDHPTFVNIVQGKLKLAEWAKPGKYPRMINDFTVVGSLLGGFVAKLLKNCFVEPIFLKGCSATFVSSPSPEVMPKIFEAIHTGDEKVHIVYFSDDAVISVKQPDGSRHTYNMDIKSADRSHHDPVFHALGLCIDDGSAFADYHRRNISQCILNLSVRRGQAKQSYHTQEHTLFSGSTLTTLVNNMANLGIFAALVDSPRGTSVASAALRAGYIVTGVDLADRCTCIEDIQFLKHSCSVIDNKYNVWLNIGVILRTLGNCKQDLPVSKKKASMQEKAHDFNYSLVQSFRHSGDHPILEMLQRKFSRGILVDVSKHLPYHGAHGCGDLTAADICHRYKCDEWALDEFCHLYSTSGYGDSVNCLFVRQVMKIDYGL